MANNINNITHGNRAVRDNGSADAHSATNGFSYEQVQTLLSEEIRCRNNASLRLVGFQVQQHNPVNQAAACDPIELNADNVANEHFPISGFQAGAGLDAFFTTATCDGDGNTDGIEYTDDLEAHLTGEQLARACVTKGQNVTRGIPEHPSIEDALMEGDLYRLRAMADANTTTNGTVLLPTRRHDRVPNYLNNITNSTDNTYPSGLSAQIASYTAVAALIIFTILFITCGFFLKKRNQNRRLNRRDSTGVGAECLDDAVSLQSSEPTASAVTLDETPHESTSFKRQESAEELNAHIALLHSTAEVEYNEELSDKASPYSYESAISV